MLRNSLFGDIKLTKNPDLDKYSFSGYGISFDVRGTFSLPIGLICTHLYMLIIYLFVNTTKIYQLKAKDSEITTHPLCLGNISKDFSINAMKKTGLNGYAYHFWYYSEYS